MVKEIMIIVLCVAELVFGVLFNAFTAKSERGGWIEGLTSLYVALGVAVTILIVTPLIGWNNAIVLIMAFVCSGIPMILGSLYRHNAAEKWQQHEILKVQSNDGCVNGES